MIWYSLVHIGIVFVLIRCSQGNTRGVVSHFNAKRHSNANDYLIERHRFKFEELEQLRARRQTEGSTDGEPVATRSSIPDDTHQYGRVSYSGEGSEVSRLDTQYN